MNEASKSSSRVIELDALRALAAINLMLFHFTFVFQSKYGFTSPLGFQLPFGKYGVELFFMLSGFVNAMTLLKKRQADEFLAARLIRILPCFYLLVLINLVLLTLSPLNQTGSYSIPQVMANLTLMPNLFGYECLEPVTWTLQIELLFYGILILLFLAGAMDQPFRPMMLYLLLCLVGGQILLHLPTDRAHTVSGAGVILISEILLFKYMPLFMIGMFLHRLKHEPDGRWASVTAIVLSATVFHLIDDHDHNPAVTILLIGLLALSAFGKIPLLRTPVFVFLSGISYSLYLVHNNLGCVLMHRLDQWGVPPNLCLIAALGMSITIAAAVSAWVERPLSQWLVARWKQARTRFLAPANPSEQVLASQGSSGRP